MHELFVLAVLVAFWSGVLVSVYRYGRRDQTCRGLLLGLVLLLLASLVPLSLAYQLLLAVFGACLVGTGFYDRGNSRTDSYDDPVAVSRGYYRWILFLVLLVALLVRLPEISEYGVRWDEHWHVRAALGHVKTGDFHLWDVRANQAGRVYDWGSLFTWQIATVLRSVGLHLGSLRLVSVAWGMALFGPIYWIGRELKLHRHWQILVFLWVALSPFAMTLSRWIRLYAMFVPVYLVLVLVLFWLIERAGTPTEYLLGGAGSTVAMGVAYHLHPLTVGLVPALVVYLLLKAAGDPSGLVKFSMNNRLMVFASALGALAMGWLFFPNFYFLGDVGLSGRLHWEYLLYFLQDHYGFGIGTVFLGSCLVGPFWRESFERYLIVMILVPLLLFVTVTNRTPHVRYVVHLILLSVPLFIKMFQRLERILVRESRLLVLFLVFLVGALLIHDFPARARYIYDGNYGYVHIPGVRTPKYRNGMKFVREHSRTTDRIAVLHWHFFWYIHPIDRARLDRANAHFLLFDSSEARRVLGQISRSESGPDWLVLPVLLKKIMEPDYRRDLKAYCDPVGVPPDWYLDIYRCRTEQVIPSSS